MAIVVLLLARWLPVWPSTLSPTPTRRARGAPVRAPGAGRGPVRPVASRLVTAPIIPGAEPWSAHGGVPRRARPARVHRQPPVHAPPGRGPGRRRLHRRAAAAARPRHRRRGHDPHAVGGLVGGRRGRTTRPWPPGATRWRSPALSMGGTLTCWLAERPSRDRGDRRGQPVRRPPGRELPGGHRGPPRRGHRGRSTGVGSDIAKEGMVESAYPGHAARRRLSRCSRGSTRSPAELGRHPLPGPAALQPRGPRGRPRRRATSSRPGWAGPSSGSGSRTSYHVATLDYDADR